MSQEEFLLKWNDHHSSFFSIVEDLCRTEQLCDVTLACGGQVFETHKLILSVCSPYFRSLLNRGDKHPIVYLKDVNPKHLEQLLSYMYRGEINVLQNDLGPLIETARGLQIKGLADAGNGERKNGSSAPKRTRTPTPAPTQAKLAKLEQSKPKSIEMTSELSYEPTTVDPGPLSVKQENNSQEVVNWGEDSSDTYDNIPNENYEQELQLEDEQYIQPDGLSGHQILMLQKEIQKKYPCEFCHKRFPTPSKLHRHKLVHSGEKPYLCQVCLKGFTQKVHLNTHKKLSHPESYDENEKMENLQLGYNMDRDPQIVHSGSDSENSLFIHTEGMEEERA